MTLREQAQFIDELRQHYRRLDGLLVVYAGALPSVAAWEFTEPMLALRKLLFGEVGNPNLKAASAASSAQPRRSANGEATEADSDHGPGNTRAVASAEMRGSYAAPSTLVAGVKYGRLVSLPRQKVEQSAAEDAPEAPTDLLSELERSREAATAGQVEDPEDAAWDRHIDDGIEESRGM